jgi:hypothetical protein
MNRISKRLILFTAATILTLFSFNIKACEIIFSVDKNKKVSYSIGDTLVIKILVVLTHRNCEVAMDKTKVDSKGLDIKGATKWVESKPGTWERKFKVIIKDSNKGNVYLSAIRDCDEDGGKGSIKLEVK